MIGLNQEAVLYATTGLTFHGGLNLRLIALCDFDVRDEQENQTVCRREK